MRGGLAHRPLCWRGVFAARTAAGVLRLRQTPVEFRSSALVEVFGAHLLLELASAEKFLSFRKIMILLLIANESNIQYKTKIWNDGPMLKGQLIC